MSHVMLRVLINVCYLAINLELTTLHTHVISKDKIQAECDVPASTNKMSRHIDVKDLYFILFIIINSYGLGCVACSNFQL
jgi:hypothetical protein